MPPRPGLHGQGWLIAFLVVLVALLGLGYAFEATGRQLPVTDADRALVEEAAQIGRGLPARQRQGGVGVAVPVRVRKAAARVPPPRRNLVRFHGVFPPGAKLRPFLVPAAATPEEEETPAGAGEAPRRSAGPRTPRLDWAGLLKHTFKEDVLLCRRCGGRRRVVAYLTHSPTARGVLQHLGLPADVPPLAPARGPPQHHLWQ